MTLMDKSTNNNSTVTFLPNTLAIGDIASLTFLSNYQNIPST